MKNQTAVEWIWRWIMDNPFGSFEDGVNAYNKAKEMEKEQIEEAFDIGACEGFDYGFKNFEPIYENGEKYYNKTYK